MGIQGLLPLLKSTMEPIHIKQLEGCSVAVDTYSWLHKGALSCSRDLCKGLPTTRHIDYCMHRVNLLRHFAVKPILVFDGGFLPMKMEQENKRARSRKENLARAIEHEANGNSAGAYECFQKAVDITPTIAHELIQVLRKENVSYVVAPYEADAQMTYMALQSQVHAVITEDSDLIPFGCPRIIFKMDKFGQGQEFHISRLEKNKEIKFSGFTKMMVLEMCIFSGCDYLQSLPGMGLKRAHSLVSKFKSRDKVIRHLKYSGVSIPPLYEDLFKKAVMTFQHQRVYDVLCEDIVHLCDVSDDLCDDLEFLGPSIPQDLAAGIAKGDLDPLTKKPLQVLHESIVVKCNTGDKIVAFQDAKKHENGRKKLDLPVQKNLLTKYFCFASLEAKKKFKAPRRSPMCSRDSSDPQEEARCEDNESSDSLEMDDNDVKDTNDDSLLTPNSDKMVHDTRYTGQNHMQTFQLLKECDMKPVLKEQICSDRKTIVSRYFQHKTIDSNDRTRDPSNCAEKERESNNENNTHEPHGLVNSKSKLKRKRDPTSVFKRNQKPSTCTVSDAQNDDHLDDDVATAKFGSNVSHIGRFNGIAEKSMEKFVSMISSFSYNSSGSRASGLRAPLKDIPTVSSNRHKIPDFARFSYNFKPDKN